MAPRIVHPTIHVAAESRREPVLPDGVLGMLIFVVMEIMFFGGMISGFFIVKGQAAVWPPPGQPRLPIEATAFNTAVLIASAGCLYLARRRLRPDIERAKLPLYGALALGSWFVVAQGFEWVSLISQGLTLQSSNLGGFFYLIVGIHALHAIAALLVLANAAMRLQNGWLSSSQLAAAEVFWYFVVGLWPILYAVVYL